MSSSQFQNETASTSSLNASYASSTSSTFSSSNKPTASGNTGSNNANGNGKGGGFTDWVTERNFAFLLIGALIVLAVERLGQGLHKDIVLPVYNKCQQWMGVTVTVTSLPAHERVMLHLIEFAFVILIIYLLSRYVLRDKPSAPPPPASTNCCCSCRGGPNQGSNPNGGGANPSTAGSWEPVTSTDQLQTAFLGADFAAA